MSRGRTPRIRSLVQLREVSSRAGRPRGFPFKPGKPYLFLGEIPNMPGHCVVADPDSGRIWAGFHTEHFRELNEGEV